MSSIPPSDPAPLRPLGSGNPGPVKSPLIVGLIALLVLVALPLYLLRRPRPMGPVPVDAALSAEVNDAALESSVVVLPPDAGATKRIVLGEPHTVRCNSKGGGRVLVERCDHLVAMEDALARSIRDNAGCAPPSASPFTVSFVLTVDFERKKIHVWAGRSGSLKKRSSGDLIRCVEHTIAPPDFASFAHQYARYDINVIASYPAGAPVGGS